MEPKKKRTKVNEMTPNHDNVSLTPAVAVG